MWKKAAAPPRRVAETVARKAAGKREAEERPPDPSE